MYPIGILALQGAFIEHETMLRRLGAPCVEFQHSRIASSMLSYYNLERPICQ